MVEIYWFCTRCSFTTIDILFLSSSVRTTSKALVWIIDHVGILRCHCWKRYRSLFEFRLFGVFVRRFTVSETVFQKPVLITTQSYLRFLDSDNRSNLPKAGAQAEDFTTWMTQQRLQRRCHTMINVLVTPQRGKRRDPGNEIAFAAILNVQQEPEERRERGRDVVEANANLVPWLQITRTFSLTSASRRQVQKDMVWYGK